jgi:flagellar hook protein FlgE
MSISSSLYTALSGLSSSATAMSVTGDNISNINTTGFKSSSAQFADILGISLSGVTGSNQTGAGALVQSIDVNYTQGTLDTTNVPTDLAVNGKGFFIVKDPSTGEEFYTRDGHFHFDNQGYYVDEQGDRVQGYLYDTTGTNLIENLADIQINQNSMIAPQVTKTAQMVVNLNSSATPTATGFQISDPSGTSNYAAPMTIYDSLGQAHTVQVYFTDVSGLTIGTTTYGPDTWQWNAVIPSSDVSTVGGAAPTNSYVTFGSGTLVFKSTDGSLNEVEDDNGKQPTTISDEPLYDGDGGAIIYANGVAATDSTIDFTGTTQYGTASATQSVNQNGYAPGTTASMSVDAQGNVTANYTNGIIKKIAAVTLANFADINGLQRSGSNDYSETVASGQPVIDEAGNAGMGTISSSMLEESNVDLAGEIINMIVLQRGYEANSKVITTIDQMMNTLVQIQ